MNKYQREVEEMDRRHQRLMRAISFIGAACLVGVALWSADIKPSEWDWWSNAEEVEENLPAQPTMPMATPIPEEVPPAIPSDLAGTDSSISPVPQALHLIATSPGRIATEGTARIGTARGNPQTYIAGAILVNGAAIAEIHSDRVLLRRGKEEVTLLLGADSGDQPESPLAIVAASTNSPPSDARIETDRLSDVIRSAPYYENEVISGLQVYPGQKSWLFDQLGLKPGDIIVAIDGGPVLDSETAVHALRTLAEGASLAVDIRNDVESRRVILDGAVIERSSAAQQAVALALPPM